MTIPPTLAARHRRLAHASAALAALLSLLSLPLLPRAVTAESLELWRVGVADSSSGEFRHVFEEYRDASVERTFRVGRDAANETWPAFHPGPASGLAGGREHPYEILFDLEDEPRGVYQLRVSVLYQTPRLSHLRVDVNGNTGSFYFDPVLDHALGDQIGITVPHTSHATRLIQIPASYLRRGANRLVLTALDEPAESEPVWAWTPGHTGFFYDVIALEVDRDASYDAALVSTRLAPTIFTRVRSAEKGKPLGGAAQVLRASVAFHEMPPDWTLRIRFGNHTRQRRITTTDVFGERRFDIDVPAFRGDKTAFLSVRADRRKLHSEEVSLSPGRQWTLFVVPLIHLDVGFTHTPAVVEELQSEALDEAIRLANRDPNYRLVVDGYWVVERFLAGRSAKQREALLDAIRRGQIAVPPQLANLHTGTASLEGLIRSLYGGHFFAARNALPLSAPHIVDVPTYTGSYASVLRAAGHDRFLAAANSWRAPVLMQGRWHERSPFLWEGPDGGRVLMWYARGYNQLQTLLGSPAKDTAVRGALPVFLQAYDRPAYRSDSAIIFGTQSENASLDPAQTRFVRKWSSRWAWPKLKLATTSEALAAIEKSWQGELEVAKGDFGPYWEDGAGADARHTALHRENQARITSAETLSTLASLHVPGVKPDTERLGRAWNELVLGDEHTFSSMLAVSEPDNEETLRQTEIKRARDAETKRAIDATLARSFEQLGGAIEGTHRTLAIFNAQSQQRSGLVEIDLPTGMELVDLATKAAVALELLAVRESRLPSLGVGHTRVRFLAEDVPPVGYKLYKLRSGPKGFVPEPPEDLRNRKVFETRHYRVELDGRGIASIRDKEVNVELLETESPYRLGSLLRVTGGDGARNTLYRYSKALPEPALSVDTPRAGTLVSARRLPFATVLEFETRAEALPRVRTLVRLYHAEKKIELEIELEKDAVRSKEAIYVAFPLANPDRRFAYSTQNGWVDPAVDTLLGGSREWFAASQWAAVRGPQATTAVTPLDAPLVTFGDVVRGRWPIAFEPATGTLFSWVMNNYWPMNFAAEQGGTFRLRYVLRSYPRFAPGALTRDALSDLSPLEVAHLTPGRSAPGKRAPGKNSPGTSDEGLPGSAASLLDLGTPNLAIVTWKLAEDGAGTILRLVEIAGRPGATVLAGRGLHFERAFRANAMEESQEPLNVTSKGVEVRFAPFEILTIRLE